MATSQNTPVVIGDSISTSLKSAHLRKLKQFSEETGHPLSAVLNRAVSNFMAIEAPVYLAQAKRKQRQKS